MVPVKRLIEQAMEAMGNAYAPYSGFRVRKFEAICIVGGMNGIVTDLTAPCGVCRQVMMEFCQPDQFQIILALDTEHYEIHSLEELLPVGFGPANLVHRKTSN